MKVPIACDLEADDARSQLGEWHEVLRQVVASSERSSPNRLELTLSPESEVGQVIDLAQRETACCPFFAFTMEIRVDRLVLVVEVPDDAVAILDLLDSNTTTQAST
ncbi:MAG: hypothetical protein ACRDYE_05960 [Acidimicrobiales bacterium]